MVWLCATGAAALHANAGLDGGHKAFVTDCDCSCYHGNYYVLEEQWKAGVSAYCASESASDEFCCNQKVPTIPMHKVPADSNTPACSICGEGEALQPDVVWHGRMTCQEAQNRAELGFHGDADCGSECELSCGTAKFRWASTCCAAGAAKPVAPEVERYTGTGSPPDFFTPIQKEDPRTGPYSFIKLDNPDGCTCREEDRATMKVGTNADKCKQECIDRSCGMFDFDGAHLTCLTYNSPCVQDQQCGKYTTFAMERNTQVDDWVTVDNGGCTCAEKDRARFTLGKNMATCKQECLDLHHLGTPCVQFDIDNAHGMCSTYTSECVREVCGGWASHKPVKKWISK